MFVAVGVVVGAAVCVGDDVAVVVAAVSANGD